MLEALRVMAMTKRRLTNSVVFRKYPLTFRNQWLISRNPVFNGAEESLQDASHRPSFVAHFELVAI